MDEIRESILGKENKKLLQDNLISKIPASQEYELIMNCDKSDYIIYYKKR